MPTMSLTEEEAATYDRQIRLWGLDAQKRLRAARICVLGIYGLGSEVCKNLVLAGIKSLCIVDHRTVGKDSIGAQFLIGEDDAGKSIAQVAATRLQILNPNVQIHTQTSDPELLEDSFFKDFDVVCVLGLAAKSSFLERVDDICRAEGIKFYSGEVYGFHGCFFTDLGSEYEYVIEEIKDKSKVSIDAVADTAAEPSAKKAKVDEEPPDDSTKMIKQCMAFAPWKSAVCSKWSHGASARTLKRASPIYFVFLVLQEFIDSHGRTPSCSSVEADIAELRSLRDKILTNLSLQTSVVDDALLRQCVAELSPVCAILGGVLAQEVIKAVSGKDVPLNNFFFYHGVQGNGMVEKLGYS